MSEIPFEGYVVAALAMLVIGMSKGGLGATSATIALPLLSLVMPVNMILGSMLPILILADLLAVGFHWRYWELSYFKLLVPGALVGVVLGTVFITNVSPKILRTTMGVIILSFTLYKFLEPRLLSYFSYRPRPWHGVFTGGTAGFTSTIAHIGGPPVAIYLLMQDVQPRTFIATSALFFLVLNWIKVPFYMYAGLIDLARLREIAFLLIFVPIGVYIGKTFVSRVRKEVFDKIILSILTISAILLIVTN